MSITEGTRPALTIYERINLVMGELGAVAKTSRNEAQNYMFRGIDALMTAAHPMFVKHGVIVMPAVLDKTVEYRARERGVTTHVHVRMQFTFHGLDGDSLICVTDGEAMDTADKATNKAMSAAFKYALLQALCIPLEDMQDADSTSADTGSLQGHQSGQRATAPRAGAPRETAAVKRDREALRGEIGEAGAEVKAGMAAWLRDHEMVLTRPGATVEQLEAARAEFNRLEYPAAG